MMLSEFIIHFAKNHSVQKLEDIESGILEKHIKDDIHLTKNNEVKI